MFQISRKKNTGNELMIGYRYLNHDSTAEKNRLTSIESINIVITLLQNITTMQLLWIILDILKSNQL